MIKAVFIDIDGTLLNSQREITKNTYNQIKKCMNKGIKIILASGRSRKEATEFQKKVGSSPYIISSNGASCYDGILKKEIYAEPLNKEILNKLLDYSEKNKYKITLNFEDKLVLNLAMYPDEKDKEKSYEELENIIKNEEVVQCVISNPDLEKMQEFKKMLEANFPETIIANESKRIKNPELEPSRNYYCDVVSSSVSKGRAVMEICKYLNLEYDEILTIGDGENDISMFKLTENSIAMENALENVKKQARYCTKSNDEDGVAKVLEKLN